MVKPAALYTDVDCDVKKEKHENQLLPITWAVNTWLAESLVEKNLVNRAAAHVEVWTALQRSGADIIISYAAKHAKEWIDQIEYWWAQTIQKNRLFLIFLKPESLLCWLLVQAPVAEEKLNAVLKNSPATSIKIVAKDF